MNRRHTENHETIATYDSFAEAFVQSRVGMKWPEVTLIIEDLVRIEDSFSLLDVGCWGGRLLEALETASLSFVYLGIDVASKMVESAKKAYPERNFETLAMEHIDMISDTFDRIVFLASFHHLETEAARTEVLIKARQRLRRGGKIWMTNWNLRSETNMKKYLPTHPDGVDYSIKFGQAKRFYHAFQLDELTRLCFWAGFTSVTHSVNNRNIVTIIE